MRRKTPTALDLWLRKDTYYPDMQYASLLERIAKGQKVPNGKFNRIAKKLENTKPRSIRCHSNIVATEVVLEILLSA